MSAPLVVLGLGLGIAFWVAGTNLVYNFLELVDALRPAKPEEKPFGRWLLWLTLCVVLFPLIMVLGVARAVSVCLRLVGARSGRGRRPGVSS